MTMNSFSEFLEELRKVQRISKRELANKAGLTPGYISHLTRGDRSAPSKETLEALAEALELNDEVRTQFFQKAGFSSAITSSTSAFSIKHVVKDERSITVSQKDWGEVPNVQIFYGREEERTTLEQWTIKDRCQLVAVTGIGGVGKTTLTAKLAEQVQEQFEYIFWRSLHNIPSLESILKDFLGLLATEQQRQDISTNVEDQLGQLLPYLRKHRCLIVLDNFDTILQGNIRVGQYRPGYEDYSQLLSLLGETRHQSCLILTSREKPQEVARLEGTNLPIRSLRLPGVGQLEGQAILRDGGLYGSDEGCSELTSFYSGNPLALKLLAEYIREVFDGDINGFLKKKELIFGGIHDLFEQQFQRLSPLEEEVIYWIAINREVISLDDLQAYMVHSVPERELLIALGSLRQRSMIDTEGTARFILQPVIMEYVTEKFFTKMFEEIDLEQLKLLKNHALTIAQAKDYVRNSQILLILEPLIHLLLSKYQRDKCEAKLGKILSLLRDALPQQSGYAAGNILNLLIHMGYDLRGYNFSSLTVWQASLQNADLQEVNFANADLSKSVFTGSFGSIFSVALSPDGQLLAAGTANSEIRMWRMNSDTPLLTYRDHTDWVRSVAFSPDGKTLASGSEDKTVRLWDAITGECLQVLHGHSNRVCAIAFSPDGKTLASGSDDRTIRFWNTVTGKCNQVLQAHDGWVYAVTFSPDGKTLASGSEDKTVRLWDAITGECLQVLHGHSNRVCAIAFSPDGKTLASGSDDRTIRFWNTVTGKCNQVLQAHDGCIYAVTFSPDGKTLASGSEDKTVRLWDANTGECLRVLHGHGDWVRSIAFSPKEGILVSGSEDQTIRFWEMSTGRCTRVLIGKTYWVYSVAFSPEGKNLVSGGEDQNIYVWEISSGNRIQVLSVYSKVRCVTFSPNGQILASGSDDHLIRFWEVGSGKCVQTLYGHNDWVRSVTFNPDSSLLASSSEDQTIRLWEVSSGKCVQILHGHNDWVYAVTFSPDGDFLASASADQTVRLWDINSGQCIGVMHGHSSKVCSVAFSPDGSLLVSSSADRSVRLWKVSSGRCIKVLQGHTDWIFSVAFSPDGSIIASGSDDQTIRLWDVNSGNCINILKGHASWVYSVAFHVDGTMLASGSDDGTVRIWDVHTGVTVHVLRKDRPYEKMDISSIQGLTQSQKEVLIELGAVER